MKQVLLMAFFSVLLVGCTSNVGEQRGNNSSSLNNANAEIVDEGGVVSNSEPFRCEVPTGHILIEDYGTWDVNFSADFDGDGIEDCVLACDIDGKGAPAYECESVARLIFMLSTFPQSYYYIDVPMFGTLYSVSFENNKLRIGLGEIDYNSSMTFECRKKGDLQLIAYDESSGRGSTTNSNIDLLTGQYSIIYTNEDDKETTYKGKAKIPTYTLANTDCHVLDKLSQLLSKNIN